VWPQKYARVFVPSILTFRTVRVALQEDLKTGIIQVILLEALQVLRSNRGSLFALTVRCWDDGQKSKIDLEHSSQ